MDAMDRVNNYKLNEYLKKGEAEAEQETLRGQPIRLSRTPVRHKTKKLVLLEIPIIDQTGKPDCSNEQQRKLKKRKTGKLKKDVELNNPEI